MAHSEQIETVGFGNRLLNTVFKQPHTVSTNIAGPLSA
ncbi:unnamed protein product, partial [marine sediment metagenome]